MDFRDLAEGGSLVGGPRPGYDWQEIQEVGIERRSTREGRRIEVTVRLERGALSAAERERLQAYMVSLTEQAVDILDAGAEATVVAGPEDGLL